MSKRKSELVAVQIPVEKWRSLASSMSAAAWDQCGMGRLCSREEALVIAAMHEANRRPIIVFPMKKEIYEQAKARMGEGPERNEHARTD